MKKWILVVIILLLILLIIIILGDLLFKSFYPYPKKIQYGVTFSPKFATQLNMDWKDVYIKILDDLKVRHLRLPTYWDKDLASVDFMLDEAQKRGAKVILVLGVRQPRWPECHIPAFARALNKGEHQEKILEFITAVVERYKSYEVVTSWQVENEPLLSDFGQDCSKPDVDFLKKEVELVRKQDKRPIVLTDSGELGAWITPMSLADVFGTTLYRTVYNKFFGFTDYPLLPYFYNVKSNLVRFLFAKNNKQTIIIELQAEPWSPNNNLVDTPITQQTSIFSEEKFRQNINYARGTGFDEVYLWGVEWWYFMEKQGDPSYLDYAKTLFLKSPNL